MSERTYVYRTICMREPVPLITDHQNNRKKTTMMKNPWNPALIPGWIERPVS